MFILSWRGRDPGRVSRWVVIVNVVLLWYPQQPHSKLSVCCTVTIYSCVYSSILLYLLRWALSRAALSWDVSGHVPEVTWPIIMLIMLIMHDALSVCYVSLWI